MTTENYIRLVAIVCGYCLIRPYLVKLGGRFQALDHEREIEDDDASELISPAAAISPNSLRGYGHADFVNDDDDADADADEDDDEEENMGDGKCVAWGKRARTRQRKVLRARSAADEKLLAQEMESNSDKEIEEFLRRVVT